MTIYDYHMVMISVNIATLKAKLSFYLGQVKQGQEVLVLDRNTPVVKIVPSGNVHKLTMIKPTRDPLYLKKMKFQPVKQKFDVVDILREERDRR